MKEKHWRSVAKAASWRVTGTVDTIVISWIITGHFKMALSIGAVEVFTKMFLYYLHERIWNRVKAGRVVGDYQI
ncbi:MAG: hypothetical protein A2351_05260 [Omnitrophica bacterium RIFOXYB12_FULL_50_7]|nr:MAG: hypothetical protein A2351_05260 [Omnitrophica bacterium RIFOXYB12_FULL_50_7]